MSYSDDEVLVRILNWSFWYAAFFFIGGYSLARALFSAAILWFILVRTFNYTDMAEVKKNM